MTHRTCFDGRYTADMLLILKVIPLLFSLFHFMITVRRILSFVYKKVKSFCSGNVVQFSCP